jgi:hypothetical protein
VIQQKLHHLSAIHLGGFYEGRIQRDERTVIQSRAPNNKQSGNLHLARCGRRG